MTNINDELNISIENFIKHLVKYPQEKQVLVFKTTVENIYEAGKSSGKREAQNRKEVRI